MEPLSPNYKKYTIALLVVAIVCFFIYFFFLRINLSTDQKLDYTLSQSVTGEKPEALQDFLVDQIKDGKKDDAATLAAIYWVSHRYFDNGGNIYEIYDFVNSHPEVAFLKEAEAIYPTPFEHIRSSRVANYSPDSLYGILGYYEAMEKNGYASVAVWGTAANKYSEMAIRITPKANETAAEKDQREKFQRSSIDRADYFANRVRMFIIENTKQTGSLDELSSTTVNSNDLLVGLNQYASARENLKGIGIDFYAEFTPIEIFEFNSQLALNKVPRLYFFTNYLYATALVHGGEATAETVKLPLTRVVEYGKGNPGGIVDRLIKARTNRELGLFEYPVVQKLAALDQNFKDWLMQNGWKETDFQ